jgi:hypothetical protein
VGMDGPQIPVLRGGLKRFPDGGTRRGRSRRSNERLHSETALDFALSVRPLPTKLEARVTTVQDNERRGEQR